MLKDKVVIVTGGPRGIGYETVKLFAENGAKVVLFGSKKDSVDKAIENLKKENYGESTEVLDFLINKLSPVNLAVNFYR